MFCDKDASHIHTYTDTGIHTASSKLCSKLWDNHVHSHSQAALYSWVKPSLRIPWSILTRHSPKRGSCSFLTPFLRCIGASERSFSWRDAGESTDGMCIHMCGWVSLAVCGFLCAFMRMCAQFACILFRRKSFGRTLYTHIYSRYMDTPADTIGARMPCRLAHTHKAKVSTSVHRRTFTYEIFIYLYLYHTYIYIYIYIINYISRNTSRFHWP